MDASAWRPGTNGAQRGALVSSAEVHVGDDVETDEDAGACADADAEVRVGSRDVCTSPAEGTSTGLRHTSGYRRQVNDLDAYIHGIEERIRELRADLLTSSPTSERSGDREAASSPDNRESTARRSGLGEKEQRILEVTKEQSTIRGHRHRAPRPAEEDRVQSADDSPLVSAEYPKIRRRLPSLPKPSTFMKWNRPMLSSIRGTSKNKESVLVATTASDGSSSDSAKEEEVPSVIVRAPNTAGEELHVVSDADSTALHRETTGNATSTVHVRKASSDKGGSERHDNYGKSSSTRAVGHGNAGSNLAPGTLPHRDHGNRDDTSIPRGSHHHDEKRSRRHTPSSKRPRRRRRSSSSRSHGRKSSSRSQSPRRRRPDSLPEGKKDTAADDEGTLHNKGPVETRKKRDTDDHENRRRDIKPDKFNGSTCVETFLVKFDSCARYNEWNSRDKTAHLKASLTGPAGLLLWESDDMTYEQLVEKLRRRYGSREQQEKFRVELRYRRRKPGESLQELVQDVERLITLAYPTAGPQVRDVLGRDAFIDALDDATLAFKVREKEPEGLNGALTLAMKLEVLQKARDVQKDTAKPRLARGALAADEDQQRQDSSAHTDASADDQRQRGGTWRQGRGRGWRGGNGVPISGNEPARPSETSNEIRELKEQVRRLTWEVEQNKMAAQYCVPYQQSAYQAPTLGSDAPAQNSTTARTRPPPTCFGCGMVGHIRRNCTNNSQGYGPVEQQQPTTSRARGVSGHHSTEAYLQVRIGGRQRACLLDTGCEVTVIPAGLIGEATVRPTEQRLLAANGTQIPILGRACIKATLGGRSLDIDGLVSEHVAEVMLGIDWLQANAVVWDFAANEVVLDGCTYKLAARSSALYWCRKVVLVGDTTVPARSQLDVSTNLVCQRLDTSQAGQPEAWGTELRQIKDGILVARTIVPNRASDLPVRVMNTTHAPVMISKGTTISELQPIEPVIARSAAEETRSTAMSAQVIEDMMSHVDSSIPEGTRAELRCVLEEYSDVFSKDEWDLGRTSLVTHSIDTGDNRPIRQQMRRYPPAHLQAIDQHIADMRKQGIIEPTRSPWASNIVLAKKKDGTLRCCVDYRQLNAITRKDAYPLPRTDACLDAMSGSRWFTTFDLRSSYHQVAMDPADSDKTAFVTRRGMFKFRTMPFGLCNAGATFQRLMDLMLTGLNLEVCLVYLDDIIIYSSSLDQHLERLVQVLERLRQSDLKLKPSKCRLMQLRVNFLGHVVSGDGIATDPEKVRLVVEWPVPRQLRDLRGFLGLTSYYRRFVKHYADIAAPLNALTKKGRTFIWTSECQTAFERLKEALSTPPVLAMPDNDSPFILDTDASDCAIGSVLSQVQGGQERVIAYAGRALSRNEINYCVTRKELLAVVNFTRYFRQYLLGKPFTIRTDHAALSWLKKTPEPIGQNARWLELLGEYEYNVVHRPGARHGNADAISRRPCLNRPSCSACHPETARCANVTAGSPNSFGEPANRPVWTNEEITEAQRKDREIGVILALLESGAGKPPWEDIALKSTETKTLWNEWERLAVREGVLCRRWITPDGLNVRWQIVMPHDFRSEFIRLAHTGMSGGHMGRSKTEEQVRLRAYWPNWMSEVRLELKRCAPCAQYRRGTAPRQFHLNPFPAGEPFEVISIDITGRHPRSSRGHEYILTVVDSFTKWAEAYPIRVHTAPVVARTLMDNFFSRFGMPKRLLSDQGAEFESELFRELCRWMGIEKIRSSPYRPTTNGTVERFHRTLNSMLGKVVAQNQRDWHEHLPSVMAAYRASKHESTGYSPNFLLFSRENTAPVDLVFGVVPGEEAHHQSTEEYVAEMQRRQRESYALARQHLEKAAERRKKDYDIRVKPQQFQVGQWVWYFYPRRYAGRSPKWSKYYQGPYLVTRVIPPCDFVIQRSRRCRPQVVHGDKLKPCHGETPVSWLETGGNPVGPNEGSRDDDRPGIPNRQSEDAVSARDRHRQPRGRRQEVISSISDSDLPTEAPLPPRVRRRPAYLTDFAI